MAQNSDISSSPFSFPLKVPPSFARRIQPNNPDDPLLLQVLPRPQEFISSAADGYTADPLSENQHSPLPGVVRKYHGRVLLLITADCPINCRFCFRRHFRPQIAADDWGGVFAYLAQDKSINEIILSGGEPLLWSDEQLARLFMQLLAIPHIRRLRIHTRMPVVAPERITADLCRMLHSLTAVSCCSPTPVMVVHCNHAQEIDAEVMHALTMLRQEAGITLLSQTVLLKDINDKADALVALYEKLFAVGVLPYYLHLLDRVQGAAHFAVDDEIAKKLWRELAQRLPGYLVPRLVRDGAAGKRQLVIGD